RADLYRLARIADDTACNVVDRPGCPIAPGSVNRLCVAWVHHIAWRSGGDDATCDHSAPMTPAATPGPHPHPRRRHWAEASVAVFLPFSRGGGQHGHLFKLPGECGGISRSDH